MRISAGLKLANAQYLTARNAADTADVNIIQVNASNYIQLGARLIRDDLGAGGFGDTSSFAGFKRRMVNLTGTPNTPFQIIVQGYGCATASDQHQGLSVTMNDESGAVTNKTITGAANNGSGLIRITATAHGYSTGDKIGVYGVGGTTEANGAWTITRIAADTFDLQGSTFTNVYTAGGTATNRPSWYGVSSTVAPIVDRGSLTGTALHGDDVNCFIGYNGGTAKATDAYYLGRNTGIAGSEWTTCFTSDANADYGIRLNGTYATAGLDFSSGTQTGPAIKLGAAHNIQAATATGTKIGTATNQLLGFWNATPVAQQATTATATGFTAGTGTAAVSGSTWTGGTGTKAYNVSDIVLALKNTGILAS